MKLLKRGLSVVVGGVKSWLPIKYESLPLFCYNCGMIGHTFKSCDALDHIEDQCSQEMAFGPDIKASPMKKSRPWPPNNEFSRTPHSNTPSKSATKNPINPYTSPSGSHFSLSSSNNDPNKNKKQQPTLKKCLTKSCNLLLTPASDSNTNNSDEETHPPMDLDCSMPPLSQAKLRAFTNLTDSAKTPRPPIPPPNKPTKKEWKRLARAKANSKSPMGTSGSSGKRPLETNVDSLQNDFYEAKRLKFLSLSVEELPTVEAAVEQPRRSK